MNFFCCCGQKSHFICLVDYSGDPLIVEAMEAKEAASSTNTTTLTFQDGFNEKENALWNDNKLGNYTS